MKISAVFATLVMALVVAFVTLRSPATPTPNALDAATFTVDPVHSTIHFKIRHMGVSNFYGRFNDFSGHFAFDPNDLAAANFEFTVEAASVDTGNDGRDGHLRTPDFFGVDSFATISFKSTSVKPGSKAGTYDLTGDLTLLGKKKTITVPLEWFGTKDGGERMGVLAGFESIFTIKRSDFGMNYGLEHGALGDEVTLIVAIEGRKAKPEEAAE